MRGEPTAPRQAPTTEPVLFFLPRRHWPCDPLPATADDPLHYPEGILTHTLQTYLRLRNAGYHCELVDRLPRRGLVVSHRVLLNWAPFSPDLFLVNMLADRGPHGCAQAVVTQNPRQAVQPRHFLIPQWPQPGLNRRDPRRGQRFEVIAYFGRPENLAPELRQPQWAERLRRIGLEWRIVGHPRHDYHHVPTVFIPHAGVMKGLPPLCFDVAFLEGLVAAQRYREFGPTQTAILLAGNCRLDVVLRKPLPGPGAILFCPSLGDEVSAILESVSKVLAAIPDGTVILRPHPRDPMRDTYLEASKKFGCMFSDARDQRAEAALIPVNAVICGDSNIILEAKLTRRWVAVFFASGSISDHYGYIAEGIPDAVCWHAGEVIEFLQNTYTSEPPLFDGINRFMSTSGTCWEGRSAELIAESLRDLTGIQSQYGSVLWERVDACPQQQVFIPRQGGCTMPTRGRVAGG